ncbi:hypothetical protein [Myxococcus phage Mx1]|nr:hypothetical protein [Myxococcus phage Mx1]
MAKPYNDGTLSPFEGNQFDPALFDERLRAHGVLMQHWCAIKCPLGVSDRFDERTHHGHSNCSNGFIYKHAGDVTCFFNSNSSSARLEELGIWDGATVQVTIPRYYDCPKGQEVAVQNYDRFFLAEIATTSVTTQLVEAHITGRDRLQYRAVEIEYVIDANGVEYAAGDYCIDSGHVVWNGDRRPQFDAKTGRGTTYAIRYRYVPFWYVRSLIHEVRVAKVFDYEKNGQVLVRMPHALSLQREYAFENEERVATGRSDERDVKAPRTGSFGPR